MSFFLLSIALSNVYIYICVHVHLLVYMYIMNQYVYLLYTCICNKEMHDIHVHI